MTMYKASDGSETIEIEAANSRQAAEEYVRTGQWDHAEPGATVEVAVREADVPADRHDLIETYTVEIQRDA